MAIAKSPPEEEPEKLVRKAFKITWLQFSSTTSTHGARHVNDKRGNRITRALWVFLPIFCFICATVLMVTFLMRYKSNPTRINVERNFAPISETEFPAVTFCNPNFITDSQAYALIRSLETFPENYNATDEEIVQRIKYTAGYTMSISIANYSELDYLQELMTENRFDVPATMKKLMLPCTKLLIRCRWEGVIMDCKDLFSVSETSKGYCCSFNTLKPVGSSVAAKVQTIRKTQFFGPDLGLSVVLNPLVEPNALTSVNSEGMRLLINEFNLYPSDRSIAKMLPHKQETFVEIRTERTDCSSRVRSLPISDRGCVFDNEHQLRFFPIYSEENCRVECSMNQHIKTCECLPYFFYNTDNVETCSFKNIQCMVENKELLRNINHKNATECVCPSQCMSRTYDLRISSASILINQSYVIDPFHFNLTDQMMIVHVYFVSQNYRVFIRSLLTNFISLIANLGGVYSLLIGMSILSLIEFIYFFSVRFYLNFRHLKYNEEKPKTFSQRMQVVNISSLKVPRLDTAKSVGSDISGFRMSAMSHF